MFVGHMKDIKKTEMMVPGAVGAHKQVAIGPKEGWDGHVLRVMSLDYNGHTPKHIHGWPHINYVLSGQGVLIIDGQEHVVEEGTCAYIPAESEHCFKNAGEDVLKFICIVPEVGEF